MSFTVTVVNGDQHGSEHTGKQSHLPSRPADLSGSTSPIDMESPALLELTGFLLVGDRTDNLYKYMYR